MDNDHAEDENNTAPEFLEHPVMPEDTMTGICMRYKVKSTSLTDRRRGVREISEDELQFSQVELLSVP